MVPLNFLDIREGKRRVEVVTMGKQNHGSDAHPRTRPLLTRSVDPSTRERLREIAEARGVSEGVALDAAVEHYQRCIAAEGPRTA
jgi:hypothetical protein